MGEKTLQELVEAYCKDPSDGLRNVIVSKSIPLVRSIIGKIKRPNSPLAAPEDLESAAISGLLQALDTYNTEKNVQFNTYSYYRIRGSIIDYLRKIDHLPRQQRKAYGEIKETIKNLTQKLGRLPGDDEVADELDITPETYRKQLSVVQQRNALSLDSTYENSDGNMYDTLADPESEMPDDEIEKNEVIQRLKEKIGQLEERDRLILTLYYFEEMTMSEIALLLELSEARISQIVGKLLIHLKSEMTSEGVRA